MANAVRYFALFTLVTACGGGASEVPPPSTPSAESTAAADLASGEEAAPSAAPAEMGAAEAEPAAATPATCDSPASCAELGATLADKGDRAGAKVALEKSCSGGVKVIDGCARLAILLSEDTNSDPAALAVAAQHGCSAMGSEASNRAIRGKACVIWGKAQRDGLGAEKDLDRALTAFNEGCRIGESAACQGAKEIQDQKDAATGVPGANMRVGRITTDGVTVEDIACKSEGGGLGGLLGSLVLGKPFADRKARLDACVKSRHKTRVRWTAANGRMSNVEVISGAHPANACIQRAMSGAPATVNGVCAASVEIGR